MFIFHRQSEYWIPTELIGSLLAERKQEIVVMWGRPMADKLNKCVTLAHYWYLSLTVFKPSRNTQTLNGRVNKNFWIMFNEMMVFVLIRNGYLSILNPAKTSVFLNFDKDGDKKICEWTNFKKCQIKTSELWRHPSPFWIVWRNPNQRILEWPIFGGSFICDISERNMQRKRNCERCRSLSMSPDMPSPLTPPGQDPTVMFSGWALRNLGLKRWWNIY